eukprot:6506046-Pyramimonas_sp.AAC.1
MTCTRPSVAASPSLPLQAWGVPNHQPRVSGLRLRRGELLRADAPLSSQKSHLLETFHATQGKPTLKRRLERTQAL